jgi:hypothetical protein
MTEDKKYLMVSFLFLAIFIKLDLIELREENVDIKLL